MSVSTPTASSLKKRKLVEDNTHSLGSSPKKAKKDRKEDKKSKDKRSTSKDGQFQVVNASVMVSIPPKFAMDPMTGAREMLDSLIMRYVPSLGGVMLCHSHARFLSQTAVIKNECPFSNCAVGFDATVWGPQIGMKLNGKINLCSPDHISLLVHQTFNVSIPRHHIPIDSWEFEHGAAENDPEFGPNIPNFSEDVKEVGDTMDADGKAPVDGEPSTTESTGSWVHKITNDKLGGRDGQLEFTVIGLTVANQMLSLVASIQPDPFSPDHVPQPAVTPIRDAASDPEDGDDQPGLDQMPDQLDDDSDDEDPFSHLGQAREEMKEREEAKKEQEAREKEEKKRQKRERKEKRKAEKAELEGKSDLPSKKRKKVKKE